MKFYLDTASVKKFRKRRAWDCWTASPPIRLVAKEGRVFREVLLEICNIVDGPISAEVVSIEADAMVKEGRELAKIHKNIVVKVPLIAEGLKATKRLAAEGIRVNVTLCFSPTQALLAAKAGAWCVSPFIGRLDDISSNGMELIRQIVTIYKNYDYKTYILVASVRHPQHVVEAALAGGHICTMPFAIFQQTEASADRYGLEEVSRGLGRRTRSKGVTVLLDGAFRQREYRVEHRLVSFPVKVFC